MKLPKDVSINDMRMTLAQNEDSCGRTDHQDQMLEVEFKDAGGGFYYVLNTVRWAIDCEDHSLFDYLDGMCKILDNNFQFNEDDKKNG